RRTPAGHRRPGLALRHGRRDRRVPAHEAERARLLPRRLRQPDTGRRPPHRAQPAGRRPPDGPALRLPRAHARRGPAPHLPGRRRDRRLPDPPGLPGRARRRCEGHRGAAGDAARVPGPRPGPARSDGRRAVGTAGPCPSGRRCARGPRGCGGRGAARGAPAASSGGHACAGDAASPGPGAEVPAPRAPPAASGSPSGRGCRPGRSTSLSPSPPRHAYRSVCSGASVRCPVPSRVPPSPYPGGPVSRTALRICPLCEATCGLTLTIDDGGRVTRARGDRDDVFSKGFICPKGAAFPALDSDPDRLRAPLVRVDGVLREATWEEAFDAVAAGLRPVVDRYGPHAVGLVLGNPNVHTMAGALYPPVLLAGLGTRSLFTASTLDQMPKHVSSGLLFGDANAIPVPDLDRTDHLLLIGANPLESNGSLCTAPDFPGRLKALRARGGTLTVVDPRRTRTARLADRHLAVRPGTDALLLAAMVTVLFEEDLTDLGGLAPHVQGVDDVARALRDFTPEAVAPACDVDADTVRALARELAAAPTAAVYARIGSCTVPHGTLASWLVDVLNTLTGNLDRPGGALFPQAATDRTPRPSGPGRGFALGRWHSRVSRHPEAKGELPLSALAEEIDTPTDEGTPVRALIAVAANPVLSAPDGDRLDKALDSLDFMVAVDPYLNETSRHADVVLPPPPPAQSPHHDFAFNTLAVRNQVRYTRPAVPLEPGRMAETEIM